MNNFQFEWLQNVIAAAKSAEHVFPEMAACEAALESGFGNSALARLDNNLFGMKQHAHAIYGTAILPTREFVGGEWKVVNAAWVKYDNLDECFADRMETLLRLRDSYPHYAAALTAPDSETYIREVSKSWSTDPDRGEHVLEIYSAYLARVGPANLHASDL